MTSETRRLCPRKPTDLCGAANVGSVPVSDSCSAAKRVHGYGLRLKRSRTRSMNTVRVAPDASPSHRAQAKFAQLCERPSKRASPRISTLREGSPCRNRVNHAGAPVIVTTPNRRMIYAELSLAWTCCSRAIWWYSPVEFWVTRMLRVLFALSIFLAMPSSAYADKRVALVIGNGAYQHAVTLTNPVNDARDVAAALTPLGFQVVLGYDLNKQAFDLKLREFARALKDADVGVFFYAGHGLQVKGSNYLVATDAKLEAESDLDFETLRVDAVLSHMDREAKTNIVFLDACRNNPLARNLARTMGTRGVGENNGLAPVASSLGTFIAFATQPGAVASDGAGRNSPFSAALKRHITAPGMSVTDLMVEVRKEVVGATKGTQVPWDHSALQGRFYFAAATPTATAVTPTTPSAQVQLSDATQAWQLVKDTQSIPALEAFVRRFGDTFQGDLAKLRLAELQQAEATRQAAEAAKRKSEDDARTKAETERQRLASLQQDEERKRTEAMKKKADEDARAKAEAERLRLATLMQKEEDRKRAEAEERRAKIARISDFELAAGSDRQQEKLLMVGNTEGWATLRATVWASATMPTAKFSAALHFRFEESEAPTTRKVYLLLIKSTTSPMQVRLDFYEGPNNREMEVLVPSVQLDEKINVEMDWSIEKTLTIRINGTESGQIRMPWRVERIIAHGNSGNFHFANVMFGPIRRQ
jgi:uncharacterized caspase-like protein